jgi:hypothetical protein
MGVGEYRTQILTVVHSYEVPTAHFAASSALGRGVLGGWTLQGILGGRSGNVLNISLGQDVVGYGGTSGGTQRPDAVPGQSPYVHGTDRLLWLNKAAYDAATPKSQKRFGTLGPYTAYGPNALTWDMSLHKSFKVREGQRLTFRFEMFNWMNHVVLGDPTTNMSSGTFGRITSGGPGWNIQLGLKYLF